MPEEARRQEEQGFDEGQECLDTPGEDSEGDGKQPEERQGDQRDERQRPAQREQQTPEKEDQKQFHDVK